MTRRPQHLTQDQCQDLARGQLPPQRLVQQLFQHLLELCPTCQAEWEAYSESRRLGSGPPPLELRPTEPADAAATRNLDSSVDRVLGRIAGMTRRVRHERREARKLLRELQELPDLKTRVTRVRRSRRFRSWALCELLFDESRRAGFEHPQEASDLAELAIETAWALDEGTLSRGLISDLLARGWALLANARRLEVQLTSAAETFLMAYFFVEQGTGDPLVLAEVMSLEASLRRDQRRLDLALRLHDRVIAIYRKAGEQHLQGRALLKKAITQAEIGDLEPAIDWIRQGLELVDPERDPRLDLCCRHTLILYLNQLGQHEEAERLLHELAPKYEAFSDRWTQLRRRWLEGEIAEGLGRLEDAEVAYSEVQQGFIAAGAGRDAALVTLNLAALYAGQGRTQELQALAAQMLQIFEAVELQREALATLILFQKAARLDNVTREMIRSLRDFLQRARRSPRWPHPPS